MDPRAPNDETFSDEVALRLLGVVKTCELCRFWKAVTPRAGSVGICQHSDGYELAIDQDRACQYFEWDEEKLERRISCRTSGKRF